MMSVNAIANQLHIVSGARQSMTSPTRALRAPRGAARGRVGDQLFVLLELHAVEPGAPIEPYNQLYELVMEQAAASYWRTRGSVTGALREAIYAANNWLMDYNLESPLHERRCAGLTCVALRSTGAYIAQAGPAACYVARQGQLERFPPRDSLLVSPALGSSRGCEVRYGYSDWQPGDMVLVCDSAAAEHLSGESITQALVDQSAPAAAAQIEHAIGSGDLMAVLIENSTEPQPSLEVSPPPPSLAQPELAAGPAVQPEPGPTPGERLSARLAAAWQQVRHPPQAQPAEADRRVPIARPDSTPRRSETTRPSIPVDALQAGFKQWLRSTIIGVVAAGQGLKTSVQRVLPEAQGQQSPARSTPGGTLIMAGLAILIPLLITWLVVNMYMQHRRQAEFDSLLNSARSKIALAQGNTDPQAARVDWQSAWQEAAYALNYDPAHTDALSLQLQAQQQLDQIDRVTRVRATALMDFGAGSGYRLTSQSVNVFVMNRNYLWNVTFNQTGNALLEPALPGASAYAGAAVGERQVGDLLDLAWVSAHGLRTKSSLLILESNGLLEYDPAWNVRNVALGQEGVRPGMRLMDTFGGNLYVLDDSQLWRYKPMGDGFGAMPEAYFNTPPGDLNLVVDLAIDGSIYLLYPNGHIRKFFGGDDQVFTPTDMPAPLARPVAIAVDAESGRGSVYVADAGGGGVVQFNPQGVFIRQIKTTDDAMAAIESIAVDERAQRLLFLSAGRLYATQMPSLQTP